jgi:hypothetical protein
MERKRSYYFVSGYGVCKKMMDQVYFLEEGTISKEKGKIQEFLRFTSRF